MRPTSLRARSYFSSGMQLLYLQSARNELSCGQEACPINFVCSFFEQEFPSYYSLQQYRRKEHGAKQWRPSDTVADLNKIVEELGEDGEKLKGELSACQHFLVDTEMENGRHKVFNLQMLKLDTKIINEKLEEVFNKLDSAAKI